MAERPRSAAAQQARESVAANLRRLRKARGLTQAELAARLGIEPRHQQMLEAGESAPSFDLLVNVADVLEVTVGELFKPAKLAKVRRGRPSKR